MLDDARTRKFGVADRLAENGYRVLVPDLCLGKVTVEAAIGPGAIVIVRRTRGLTLLVEQEGPVGKPIPRDEAGVGWPDARGDSLWRGGSH
jgi:hypothetical protein